MKQVENPRSTKTPTIPEMPHKLQRKKRHRRTVMQLQPELDNASVLNSREEDITCEDSRRTCFPGFLSTPKDRASLFTIGENSTRDTKGNLPHRGSSKDALEGVTQLKLIPDKFMYASSTSSLKKGSYERTPFKDISNVSCNIAVDRFRDSLTKELERGNIAGHRKGTQVRGGYESNIITDNATIAEILETLKKVRGNKRPLSRVNAPNASNMCSGIENRENSKLCGLPQKPIAEAVLRQKRAPDGFPQRALSFDSANDIGENTYMGTFDEEASTIRGFHDIEDDFLGDDDYSGQAYDFNGRFNKNLHPSMVPAEYISLWKPTGKCTKCNAIMWIEERSNKGVRHLAPKYGICCGNGKVKLPAAPQTPSYLWQLYNDPAHGPHFHKCNRIYNSMFAFTSTGGSVDTSINNGTGPYVYRLHGTNHHLFSSLIPDDGNDPKFCQLYIYDTENEYLFSSLMVPIIIYSVHSFQMMGTYGLNILTSSRWIFKDYRYGIVAGIVNTLYTYQ